MRVFDKNENFLIAVRNLLIQCGLNPINIEADHVLLFCEMSPANELIGIIGLEIYETSALLRSLAVRDTQRGQGLAHSLLNEAIHFANQNRIIDLFLLTETIEQMMKQQYGFRLVPKELIPVDMIESPFFNGICPNCSIMHKRLI
jgi:amino-acid N-acetyltransferase